MPNDMCSLCMLVSIQLFRTGHQHVCNFWGCKYNMYINVYQINDMEDGNILLELGFVSYIVLRNLLHIVRMVPLSNKASPYNGYIRALHIINGVECIGSELHVPLQYSVHRHLVNNVPCVRVGVRWSSLSSRRVGWTCSCASCQPFLVLTIATLGLLFWYFSHEYQRYCFTW